MVYHALHLSFPDAAKLWTGLRLRSDIQCPDCILSASNNMALASLPCLASSHKAVSSFPNSWFLSVFLVPDSGRLPWLHYDTHMFSWMLVDEFQTWNTAFLPSLLCPQTSKSSLFPTTSSLQLSCLAFQTHFSWGPLSLCSVAHDPPQP